MNQLNPETLKRIADAVYYPDKIKGTVSVENGKAYIFWDGGGETAYDPQNNPAQLLEIITFLVDKELSIEKGYSSKYEYFVVDEAVAIHKGHTLTEAVLNAAEEFIK